MAARIHGRRGRVRRNAVALALVAAVAACGGDDSGSDSSARDSTPSSRGGTPAKGGSISIAFGATTEGWDGAKAFTAITYNTLNMVVPPLAQIDPATTEPVPGIASSWEFSDDLRQLTVTLNPDATFSDGEPVTPADVVFSFSQWREGAIQGFYWDPVKTVEAGEAPGTVVFTSTKPNTSIQDLMAMPAFGVYPADFGGRTAEKYFAEPIGAGPFMIESETIGKEIVLVANPHFYEAGKPYLEQVTLRTITDPNQRLLQFESGDVQMLDLVPIDLVPQLDDAEKLVTPSSYQLFLMPNWRGAPGDDAVFRQGLAAAVDRATLIEGVLGEHGHDQPGVTPLVGEGQPGPSSGTWDRYDPDEARRLVEKSSYDGRKLRMVVDNTRAVGVLMAQAVVQQLGDVGIDVRLEQVDTATYVERWSSSFDFDLLVGLNYAVSPTMVDPFANLTFLDWIFAGAPTDQARVAYEASIGAPDDAAMDEITVGLEDWALEHIPFVPLANLDLVTARVPELRGVTLDRMGFYQMQNVYLQE